MTQKLKTTRSFDGNYASRRRFELPLELLRGWAEPVSVELKGEYLFWHYPKEWARTLEIAPKLMRHLFKAFIQLGEQKDSTGSDVLKFARRWGVLNLCEHGLPSSHILEPVYQEGFNYVRCKPQQREDGMSYEPLAMWRLYARRIKALDNIITNLQWKRESGPQDWEVITDWLPALSSVNQQDEDKVALIVNRVLEIADVRPKFVWQANKPIFTLAHVSDSRLSLLTGLIIWTALHHRFADLFTICAACSTPIELAHSQSFRRNNYCADCGKKAAWRQAAKAYREKERENPLRKKRKRLTEEEVRAIRDALKRQKAKPGFWLASDFVSELAKQYDVSNWTIYKIAEGKIWKHVN